MKRDRCTQRTDVDRPASANVRRVVAGSYRHRGLGWRPTAKEVNHVER